MRPEGCQETRGRMRTRFPATYRFQTSFSRRSLDALRNRDLYSSHDAIGAFSSPRLSSRRCALAWPAALARAGHPARRMYVSALDEAGAPVPDLGPADFVVREDNVAREVLRVEPADRADADRGARRHQPGRAQRHPRTSARRCRRSSTTLHRASGVKNEVALIAIGERPTVLTDYTSDQRQAAEGHRPHLVDAAAAAPICSTASSKSARASRSAKRRAR